MTTQLSLPFQFSDDHTFRNFQAGDNAQVLHHLSHLVSGDWQLTYVWGSQGSGKSHLLQACCTQQANAGARVSYLNFHDVKAVGVEILQGVEQFDWAVWDDVDAVAGDPVWEEALFAAYNLQVLHERGLVVSAQNPPAQVGFGLADLTSRLQAGVIFALKPLDDEDKIVVLQVRAATHGLQLNDEVARYLLNHHQRDLCALLDTLAVLDNASLAHKRRLTIPFVREVLGSS